MIRMGQNFGRKKQDKETTVFILFLLFMAVYYGWRLSALTPWYDELYTYYYFISRGPIYAAIHWPLPNNHIGYSVLSACLGIFTSPAVALRGVSYLASLVSLVLIFRIGRKCLGRGLALVPVFLYAGMKLVNQLAVQGRGYALVTLCYLTAVWELLHIADGRCGRIRDYLLFGISLVLALYAIPSSVYVVIPICLTGGVAFLIQGETGKLLRLIVTSLLSAVCTAGLYAIVWLAIGSNLLVKTEDSAYYGMGHVSVILRAPFAALGTGVEYMLATPYIQSAGREGFGHKWILWMRNLLNEYYPGRSMILAVFLILCAAGIFLRIGWNLKHGVYRRNDGVHKDGQFMELHLAVSMVCIPLMLVLLCSLPYYRVFSFAGVVVSFAAAWFFQTATEYLKQKTAKDDVRWHMAWKYLPVAVAVFCGTLSMAFLLSPSYRAQYSDREAAIEDAYAQADWSETGKVAVTDCDQEYLLLFLYGITEERITRDPTEADMVLADKYLLSDRGDEAEGGSQDAWKLYITREEFMQCVETAGLEAVYENDRFVLYK